MSPFSPAPLQESRWSLMKTEPHFGWAFTLTIGLRGPLDPADLRRALAQLVERHEILRTRFQPAADGQPSPAMVVEPRGEARLELRDWSAHSCARREVECRALERELRAGSGDGSAALCAGLARVGATEHVLVLAQSALAADWRSLWNLAQELLKLLAGQSASAEPAQFADLAQWLRDTLEGEDAASGSEHWERVDLGAAGALSLSLEHDRGARPLAGLELSRELPRRLGDALLQLARGHGLPVEALLCAVWQAWLARLAESERVVIGVRSSGRAFQGLDDTLGTFERALPVEARLDERVSLLQLARRTDEQVASGAEWHEFFQPERLGSAADLVFRYAFEYLPLQADHTRGALCAELLRRDGHGERSRGILRVEETTAGTELRFWLDARHFAASDLAALADPYLGLLENALARPEAPMASLPATTPSQHARLFQLARGPELAPDEAHSTRGIHEWIVATARKTPEAAAVRAGGVEISYATLERRSAALARELAALGVAPGTLVGVHLERSVELIVALLAVLRAGAAYVPLPPAYPRERVLSMLADSGAPVVIGSSTSRSSLEGFRGTFVSAHAPRPTTAEAPPVTVTPEDLAYLIYTSGSSGKPKGVPITHANLVHSTRARLATYPERVERYLLLSSFAFDSSVAGIFWTLTSGGTLILLPPEGFEKDLASLPALLARERPTHLLGLASLWSLVLEQAGKGELDSLVTVIVAGESCPRELVRRHAARLPRTKLYNEYGPTEGTVWSTVFDTAEPFEGPRVPIGRPIPGSTNYVLTPERELAPAGVAGELWIGGPGVAAGYLHRPELSAECFAPDPFTGGRMYRTGDRARLRPDGNLEFLGRLDQQVKVRGHRIEPGEIETLLGTHPAVREAVVLVREDGGAARLVAYVTAIGPRPAETDLLRFLAEHLPEHMLPARAVCLEDWPRLPNGKIDRKALPAPGESAGFEEPQGALEIVLAALWSDVLGLEQVGRHDDFFALGGHSLSATRLYARLKETLQITLPLRALFAQRTPAALAAALRGDPAQRARVEALAEMVLGVLLGTEEDGEQVLGA